VSYFPFDDDRLGIVLRRLSRTQVWEGLEADPWHSTVAVHENELARVRLDSTTTYGDHTPTEDGVMQRGHSKEQTHDGLITSGRSLIK
jgi:transposase